jgi:hypothetical protein
MCTREIVESLRTRLLSCQHTRQAIAEQAGGVVSVSWVHKFAEGRMTNPTVASLIALESAIDACDERKQAAA